MAGFAVHYLLKLMKLMYTNESLYIFAVSSSFSAETLRKTEELDWKVLWFKRFISKHSHKRHFGRPNESIAILSHVIVFNISWQVAGPIKISLSNNGWWHNR